MDFKYEILSALESKAPAVNVFSTLEKMRDSGLPREAAIVILDDLRDKMVAENNEEMEDNILAWLDIAHGWCNPSDRIWPE